MPATKREQELIELVEPLAQEHGLELVDLEVVGGSKNPTIRVFLDGPDGIGFDQLAEANRWLGDAVEERDPFPGAYLLEISSPGIDRPLRKRSDFERFAGEEVAIKLEKGAMASMGGRGAFAGELVGMEGDDVIVTVDGQRTAIRFDDIRKAHVKGRIDFSGKDD